MAFLTLCKVLAVPPTLTALRYIFRACLCNSQSYGCGWITFIHRRGLKIVHDLPDNQKGYRTKFAYLYSSRGWNIKTSFDIKPNLSGFNNGIPQDSFTDGVIIEYAKMDVQLGRKPMNVQLNFILARSELENENLLSAFCISLAIDRSKGRRFFPLLLYVYLFLTCDFSGVAKENLKAKNPDLMKKFNVMRFAQGANQRAAETGRLMDIHARLVYQNQSLMNQVSEDLAKFKSLLSAPKMYKLRSERRARTARDWLTSDEPEASSFLGDLTAELMDDSFMISDEKYRLAAAELGINFDSLQQTAYQKGDDALSNLA